VGTVGGGGGLSTTQKVGAGIIGGTSLISLLSGLFGKSKKKAIREIMESRIRAAESRASQRAAANGIRGGARIGAASAAALPLERILAQLLAAEEDRRRQAIISGIGGISQLGGTLLGGAFGGPGGAVVGNQVGGQVSQQLQGI